jgi:hypothetical protein
MSAGDKKGGRDAAFYKLIHKGRNKTQVFIIKKTLEKLPNIFHARSYCCSIMHEQHQTMLTLPACVNSFKGIQEDL